MTLPRKLAHKDKFVYKLIQEIDDSCTSEPIVFPDDTTPIKFVVEMNLNEFTKLFSALLTGADLSFPNDAHEVVWILLRQLECPVSLCDELIACLQPLFDALEAQISSISDSLADVTQTLENNTPVNPPGIPADTSAHICSGASFVVGFMDYEIRRVYAEAEEGLVDNLIEATVEILRAIPVIETLPFDEIFNFVNLMFANQVTDYITDYDIIYDDLIGSLSCFIEANDDEFDIDVWSNWLEFIDDEYPGNRAAMLFAAFSPLRQTFLNDILAGIFNRPTLAQWFELIMAEYEAGTQGTLTCPTYDCPFSEPIPANVDLPGTDSGFTVVMGTEYRITCEGVWNGGAGGDVDADGTGVPADGTFVLPGASVYSMIYRVGTSGSWTFVGTELIFTAGASGNLYFMINDVPTGFVDNTGEITVNIRET